jgi:hypothetical protein
MVRGLARRAGLAADCRELAVEKPSCGMEPLWAQRSARRQEGLGAGRMCGPKGCRPCEVHGVLLVPIARGTSVWELLGARFRWMASEASRRGTSCLSPVSATRHSCTRSQSDGLSRRHAYAPAGLRSCAQGQAHLLSPLSRAACFSSSVCSPRMALSMCSGRLIAHSAAHCSHRGPATPPLRSGSTRRLRSKPSECPRQRAVYS